MSPLVPRFFLSQRWASGMVTFVLAALLCLGGGCVRGQETSKETDAKKNLKKHTNRLAKETSPYLLLHAHNPVQWYPWGPEALKKAKDEDKLIFLSIGYSSCHWCHVMERESFMDEEIAAYMNKHYVCIKVDREERPDVDNIYMTSLRIYFQAIGSPQNGGWPLSMFLTPDGKPFFGGTYFPARDGDRGEGSTGFHTILQRINEAWADNPKQLKNNSEAITSILRRELERPTASPEEIKASILDDIAKSLEEQFDAEYGGFGFSTTNPRRPKFPEPSNLFFLIDRVKQDGKLDTQNAKMLTTTLDRLAMGGIRDHLGGGFHRYSVDRYWHIPHFEKMLYDNGQLATAYAETYALTKNESYRRVIDEMLQFVMREMTAKQGGFYSALDAESEGEEGKFYRWEKAEIQKTLSADEFKLFAEVYGINAAPNFEDEYYAPQLAERIDAVAKAQQMSVDALETRLTPIRKKLWSLREKRPRPLTDTKILTSWNGLMIRGFADAGRILKRPQYTAAAEKAAQFVLDHLVKDGRLMRTYGAGEAKLNAYLSDYAFLINGLLALHQATGDERWLKEAQQLQTKQDELYWHDAGGGYYFTSKDHEVLIARTKRYVDSAQPSGNSVAAENLVELAKRTKEKQYRERADKLLRGAALLLTRAPSAAPRLATAWAAFQRLDPAK